MLAYDQVQKISSYLISNYQTLSIWTPSKCKGFAESGDLVNHGFHPDVPEFDCSIATHTAQLCILGRIERNLLNTRSVAFKLRRILDILPIWIPSVRMVRMLSEMRRAHLHSQGIVCSSRSYQGTQWIPSDSSDAMNEFSYVHRGVHYKRLTRDCQLLWMWQDHDRFAS